MSNLASIGATAFQAGIGSERGFAVLRDPGDSRFAQTVRSAVDSVPIVPLRDAIERIGGD